MADQFLRKVNLTVSEGGSGLDLSEMRISFNVRQWDIQTPNVAIIRVYNLADATAQRVQKEFSRVTLQAGYQSGNYGAIFDGTIKQVRRGRESAIDSYLDILAADGDQALNFACVNTSLAAGATPDDQVNAHMEAMSPMAITRGFVADLPTDKLARGKVLYGMARDGLRSLMAGLGFSYSIQNGKLTVIAFDGFVPGEAVVINSQTGMIGIPEQTEDGIRVRCLLNPRLGIGSKLQINEKDITQALGPTSGKELFSPGAPDQALPFFRAALPGLGKDDGVYRIYVIEHTGDTRGNDWYSDITCLSIDPTVNQGLTPGLLAKGQL